MMDKKDTVWGTKDGTMIGDRVLQKDIESLRSECDDWKRRYLKAMQLEQEIESLREQLNNAVKEVGKIGRALGKAQARSDEWKRRAKTCWIYMENRNFVALCRAHPEAAKWFEEE